MKSKPIVLNRFSTVHTSFVIDFSFENNITILMGYSGIEELLMIKVKPYETYIGE